MFSCFCAHPWKAVAVFALFFFLEGENMRAPCYLRPLLHCRLVPDTWVMNFSSNTSFWNASFLMIWFCISTDMQGAYCICSFQSQAETGSPWLIWHHWYAVLWLYLNSHSPAVETSVISLKYSSAPALQNRAALPLFFPNALGQRIMGLQGSFPG